MSTHTARAKHSTHRDDRVAWAAILASVAGGTLGIAGLFQLLMGVSAALQDQVYVDAPRYVYRLDLTAWGWIHIVLGALALGLGLAILARRPWAVAGGLAVAVALAVASFLFLPYYPLGALVQLAFAVALVWAFSVLLSHARR